MNRSATPGTTKKNRSAPTTSRARTIRSFFFINEPRGIGGRRQGQTAGSRGGRQVIDFGGRRHFLLNRPTRKVLPLPPAVCPGFLFCLLPSFVPHDDAATRLVRGARRVEDELRAVAVVEGGRAFDGVSAFGERRDDLPREDREAARPLVVSKALGQRRGLRLDLAPLALAHARVPEPARTFYLQS